MSVHISVHSMTVLNNCIDMNIFLLFSSALLNVGNSFISPTCNTSPILLDEMFIFNYFVQLLS